MLLHKVVVSYMTCMANMSCWVPHVLFICLSFPPISTPDLRHATFTEAHHCKVSKLTFLMAQIGTQTVYIIQIYSSYTLSCYRDHLQPLPGPFVAICPCVIVCKEPQNHSLSRSRVYLKPVHVPTQVVKTNFNSTIVN